MLNFDEISRNFASVFRTSKTLWIFLEFVFNFCEISLTFPKPNKLLVFICQVELIVPWAVQVHIFNALFLCAPWAATRRSGPSELYPLLVFARAVPTVIEFSPDSYLFICPTKVFEHE